MSDQMASTDSFNPSNASEDASEIATRKESDVVTTETSSSIDCDQRTTSSMFKRVLHRIGQENPIPSHVTCQSSDGTSLSTQLTSGTATTSNVDPSSEHTDNFERVLKRIGAQCPAPLPPGRHRRSGKSTSTPKTSDRRKSSPEAEGTSSTAAVGKTPDDGELKKYTATTSVKKPSQETPRKSSGVILSGDGSCNLGNRTSISPVVDTDGDQRFLFTSRESAKSTRGSDGNVNVILQEIEVNKTPRRDKPSETNMKFQQRQRPHSSSERNTSLAKFTEDQRTVKDSNHSERSAESDEMPKTRQSSRQNSTNAEVPPRKTRQRSRQNSTNVEVPPRRTRQSSRQNSTNAEVPPRKTRRTSVQQSNEPNDMEVRATQGKNASSSDKSKAFSRLSSCLQTPVLRRRSLRVREMEAKMAEQKEKPPALQALNTLETEDSCGDDDRTTRPCSSFTSPVDSKSPNPVPPRLSLEGEQSQNYTSVLDAVGLTPTRASNSRSLNVSPEKSPVLTEVSEARSALKDSTSIPKHPTAGTSSSGNVKAKTTIGEKSQPSMATSEKSRACAAIPEKPAASIAITEKSKDNTSKPEEPKACSSKQCAIETATKNLERKWENSNLISQELLDSAVSSMGPRWGMSTTTCRLLREHLNTELEKMLDELCNKAAEREGMFNYWELEEALKQRKLLDPELGPNGLLLVIAQCLSRAQYESAQGLLIPTDEEWKANMENAEDNE